ncbi:MAG: hypothetical protein WC848_00870 [Parcubacteria group bacterium]|jgi:REP element-mobilizing transposase RayT
MLNKNRKSNRLQNYDYSQNGLYFITICTKDRQELFGEIENGNMVLNELGRIVDKNLIGVLNYFENIFLDAYVIMPNHTHMILEIINNNHTKTEIVGTDLVSVRNLASVRKPGKSQNIGKSQNPGAGQNPGVGQISGAGQIQDLSLQNNNPVGTDLASVRISGKLQKPGISRFAQIFKSKSTVEYIQLMKSRNMPYITKIWQRSFHDHIISNDESLNKIRE